MEYILLIVHLLDRETLSNLLNVAHDLITPIVDFIMQGQKFLRRLQVSFGIALDLCLAFHLELIHSLLRQHLVLTAFTTIGFEHRKKLEFI